MERAGRIDGKFTNYFQNSHNTNAFIMSVNKINAFYINAYMSLFFPQTLIQCGHFPLA